MRIAVTGASGFIGGAIAAAFADDGHEVVGFGRTPRGWSHKHARYRVWDIAAGPVRGDRDFDAVVHCAALADDFAPLEDAMRANLTGTRNVLACFPHARIVHLSTSSVYDAFTPTVNATEDAAPVTEFLSTYSESKTYAEFEVMGSNAVILRPHAVYGPGDTTLLPRVMDAVRFGRLLLPEGARVPHSLTHIDNLIQAVRLSLTGPAGIYNVADASAVDLSDVIEEFVARRGVRAGIVSVPYKVAYAAAAALEQLAKVQGGRPAITRYAVSQVGRERTLDITAARDQLGYRPSSTRLDGAENW